MSLTATGSSGTPRTLAPVGSHIARCVQVIDLGTQDDVSPQYGAKVLHKARITWELPLELHTFDPDKGEQPFFISKKYTLVLSDKSNLTKDLQSWRGRPFTSDELAGFNLRNVLGKACMLAIIHAKGKADPSKVYEQITAVTPVPKGMTVPPAISELLYYEVEQGKDAVYASLPQFLRDDIAKCHEWRTKPEPQYDHASTEDLDADVMDEDSDSIPF